MLSPLSIYVVLSLIVAGSKGSTLDQFLLFIKVKSSDLINFFAYGPIFIVFANGSSNDGSQLAFANGAWVEKSLPLKPSFKLVVDIVVWINKLDISLVVKICSALWWLVKISFGLYFLIERRRALGSFGVLVRRLQEEDEFIQLSVWTLARHLGFGLFSLGFLVLRRYVSSLQLGPYSFGWFMFYFSHMDLSFGCVMFYLSHMALSWSCLT